MTERDDYGTIPRDDAGKLVSYAWPGGYPVFYVVADSGVLCPDCARMAEHENLSGWQEDPQWNIIAADINYEATDLYCDHCGKRIPSAYAEDDATEDDTEAARRAGDEY